MTYLHDLANAGKLAASSYPAAATTSDAGTAADMIDTENLVSAIQIVGAVSGTTPTLAGKIQESDDNSTFTDIAGVTFTTVTAANNLQIISFQRTKRYVRYYRTLGGTTPSFVIGAMLIAQKKKI